MLLKNAPGRKNQRRKDALNYLELKDSLTEREHKIVHILEDKIVEDHVARSIRTKKDRRNRARVI